MALGDGGPWPRSLPDDWAVVERDSALDPWDVADAVLWVVAVITAVIVAFGSELLLAGAV